MAYSILKSDAYLMYLRKSRADNPNESVEEVLEKHETILQELAERDLGGRIPEHCIFREIVSGETISERPEMMRVLSMIENPTVKGVLVVEPQRLSRGDLEDCGKIVNAFRYSGTEVVAPNMVYDLTNKMQRKFFEQELMRGNDFLEYTKEILLRGRIASIKRGNYIGNIPPFGYDKVATDDGFTLKPNEYADAVKMAYEMFVYENKTPLDIARHFDKMGIKPYRSEIWEKCSIRAMLHNKHYIGLVYFGTKRTEKTVVNGQIVAKKSRPANPEDFIIAKGKHPALVSDELFEAAQEKIRNNPSHKKDFPLQNPLAGLLFCHHCGKAMYQRRREGIRQRIECRNNNGCGSKSTYLDDVVETVGNLLEAEIPRLEAELQNDSGKAKAIQMRLLEKMGKELEELHAKEEKQFDLLESGTYTEEVFQKRNKALHVQMEELKSKMYEARQQMPKEIDYAGEIIKIKEAVTELRNPDVSIETKNRLLKTVIERIEYEFIERQGKGIVRYKLHISLYV